MISDLKVPCGPANQLQPVPERVRIVYFLFHFRWLNHPYVFRVVREPPASAGAETKGCRRSGNRRKRDLARGSGDPALVFVFREIEEIRYSCGFPDTSRYILGVIVQTAHYAAKYDWSSNFELTCIRWVTPKCPSEKPRKQLTTSSRTRASKQGFTGGGICTRSRPKMTRYTRGRISSLAIIWSSLDGGGSRQFVQHEKPEICPPVRLLPLFESLCLSYSGLHWKFGGTNGRAIDLSVTTQLWWSRLEVG